LPPTPLTTRSIEKVTESLAQWDRGEGLKTLTDMFMVLRVLGGKNNKYNNNGKSCLPSTTPPNAPLVQQTTHTPTTLSV